MSCGDHVPAGSGGSSILHRRAPGLGGPGARVTGAGQFLRKLDGLPETNRGRTSVSNASHGRIAELEPVRRCLRRKRGVQSRSSRPVVGKDNLCRDSSWCPCVISLPSTARQSPRSESSGHVDHHRSRTGGHSRVEQASALAAVAMSRGRSSAPTTREMPSRPLHGHDPTLGGGEAEVPSGRPSCTTTIARPIAAHRVSSIGQTGCCQYLGPVSRGVACLGAVRES